MQRMLGSTSPRSRAWLRRAPAIYRSVVQPVWEAAGLAVTVTTTQAAGEAVHIGKQLDLATCDVLVALGGDGTLYELLQVGPPAPCCRLCGAWRAVTLHAAFVWCASVARRPPGTSP